MPAIISGQRRGIYELGGQNKSVRLACPMPAKLGGVYNT